jgi:hypothetical protein
MVNPERTEQNVKAIPSMAARERVVLSETVTSTLKIDDLDSTNLH